MFLVKLLVYGLYKVNRTNIICWGKIKKKSVTQPRDSK
jgi:hypothetical protein